MVRSSNKSTIEEETHCAQAARYQPDTLLGTHADLRPWNWTCHAHVSCTTELQGQACEPHCPMSHIVW